MSTNYFIFQRRAICAFWVLIQTFLLYGQSELGMHLGDLTFVKAKPSISIEQRSLNMKMATSGISPDFYSKVGGVAFVQTATPEFDVNSISCDVVDSVSYVIINGKSYEIHLENWMLKPIVAYANSYKNAAVTLYGDDEIPIKYHPAFIDNLLGLRLLQTDMLMSGIFSGADLAKIPTFDNRREIITHKETKSIGGRKFKRVSEYEKQSELAFNEINKYIVSTNDNPNTYVYTDYGETISFSANDSLGIQFHGAPYYRFAQIGPDTLEAVKLISSFVDSIGLRKELYYQYGDTWIFDNDYFSYLLDLKQQIKNKKKLKKNASHIFKNLQFSKDECLWLDEFMKAMMKLASNTKESNYNEQMGMNQMTKNLLELLKKNDMYLTPLISELSFVEIVKNMGGHDDTLEQDEETKSLMGKKLIMLALNWHIWKNAPDAVTEHPFMTDILKSKECRKLIHNINPLIIDEAEMTCQWSALFRYIKEKNPDNWQNFVRKVSSLNDNLHEDMRMIWTPINFDNSKYLFDMFIKQLFNSFAL